jgi:hypothetical protein
MKKTTPPNPLTGGQRTLVVTYTVFMGVVFGLVGILGLRSAIQEVSPSTTMSGRIGLGAWGAAFCLGGLGAMCCAVAVAGKSVFARKLMALLVAGAMGVIGCTFVIIGIFDPQNIQSSGSVCGYVFALKSAPPSRFGLGAMVFISGGFGFLWLTPKLFKVMKQ